MKNKMGRQLVILGAIASVAVLGSVVYSHCQVPCGIYDDPARFDMITEHITTIEKAMNQINTLSSAEKPNLNQIVRWVANKEEHADQLSQIVTHYFMAQRLKPSDQTQSKAHAEYVKKLTLLHEMLVYSMKSKQTADLSHVKKLRVLLSDFRTAYFAESAQKH